MSILVNSLLKYPDMLNKENCNLKTQLKDLKFSKKLGINNKSKTKPKKENIENHIPIPKCGDNKTLKKSTSKLNKSNSIALQTLTMTNQLTTSCSEDSKDFNNLNNSNNSIISYEKEELKDENILIQGNFNNILENIIEEETNRIENSMLGIYKDPQIPDEYLSEIYQNLIKEEKDLNLIYGYMKTQDEINEKMRALLVDWLSQVHYKFKLASLNTLFLTVYIIDRYLSLKTIKRKQLQLLGVTALLIACKYEEIYSPELRDLAFISDKSCTREEIIEMEQEILILLKFDLTIPTSLKIFEILVINFNLDEQDVYLGKFLLELFLVDYRSTKYSASLIACSVCYIILKFYKQNNDNNSASLLLINEYLHYDTNTLRECIKDIYFLLFYIDNAKLTSIKRKYLSNEFQSRLQKLRVN